MMMFIGSLGMPEIVLILTLALLIFGPHRIPEIARSLGKGFREFKQSTSGLMDTFNQDINQAASSPPPATPSTASLAPKQPTPRTAPEGAAESTSSPQPKIKEPESTAKTESKAVVEPMVIDLESEAKEAE